MWPYPKIVAHRGGGILAPENTLAAMRLAHARGFRAVEFDVMLALDAVPVLMHDPQRGRTVAGSGPVAAHTAAQLQAMDAGSWLGAEFAGEPVPSFAAVAAYCRANGLWMNVEIKPAPGAEAETGAVVARDTAALFASSLVSAASKPAPAVSSPGAPAVSAMLPLLSSFSIIALEAACTAAPDLPRGWLVDRIPAHWEEQCKALGAVSLHVNQKHLDRQAAAQVKQAGFGLFCYTVNDPARAAELLSWGVDAFCTDRLDLIGPDFSGAPD